MSDDAPNSTRKHIYLIVEGDGEEKAAPFLMRKILHEYLNRYEFKLSVLNAKGNGNITKPTGIEKFLEIARRDTATSGVLVLLDAEREHAACPPGFAYALATRSQKLNLLFPVVIVCAVCEYESWFLYNLQALIPKYLRAGSAYDKDPEKECGAKGWLAQHTHTGSYKPTINQAEMTARISIAATMEKSRSFRRLVDAIGELIEAIDGGKSVVTPIPPIPDA